MQNPFIEAISRELVRLTGLEAAAVENALAVPPNDDMGDYAFPCFAAAKALRKSPADIAAELASRVRTGKWIARAQAAGPYLNFFVNREAFVAWVLRRVRAEGAAYGRSAIGSGKTVVVEYSSPNIAKHLGIHHVRTTMIGNALDRLYRALGYNVVSINFLGDWGTQFGILIAAYKKWGGPETLEGDAVGKLNELYVRFNKEAEENPALRDQGRAWFKKLEAGDPEAAGLWKEFREVSLVTFEGVYERLGVRFDVVSGESAYDKLMPDTIRRLEAMGLAKSDEGALIVDLKAHKMPPVLLRKSDGATLYDTRDIAAAEDRWNRYHFARMVYVVGGDQKLHFRQIFKVLELMGYPWAKDCVHVDFGVIRIKGAAGAEKMSTRGGKIIMLRDVLREAVDRARKAIEQKNPDLADKDAVAEMVGVGAVVFNDLKRQRVKDVDFDWGALLSFEGDTGPYIQYAHVRLCSILRKYGGPVNDRADLAMLEQPEEFSLAKALADFGAVILHAAEANEPSVVSQYLLDLCSRFSHYYHKHQVVGEDPGLTDARIVLVDAIRRTIANGLTLLGIRAPAEM